MLDRMYKEYPKGEAPAALEELAQKIRGADGFVFVTGEYNWGVQPGLKNLTDHFLEEWFWRPAAIVSYSAGRLSGARPQRPGTAPFGDGDGGDSSTIAVGPIGQTLSAEGAPTGEGGKALESAFPRFAEDLTWWIEAAKSSGNKSRRRIDRDRGARRHDTRPPEGLGSGAMRGLLDRTGPRWAGRDEMRVQNGLHEALQARALADQLVAPVTWRRSAWVRSSAPRLPAKTHSRKAEPAQTPRRDRC